MRQSARALMWVGTAGVVLSASKVHAAYIGHYDLTSSARFGWVLAYIGLLCVAAYAAGLPELPAMPSESFAAAVGALLTAAAAISVLQLLVGSALLPRFVVLLSAVLLLPGYMICARLAVHNRLRWKERDRVVAVLSRGEAAALAGELLRNPERPATLVTTLDVDRVKGREDAPQADDGPLVRAARSARASVVVLDRSAQDEEAIVAQAAVLHEEGVRIRTLTLFYDEWLGKLPMAELERMALMFDIGEVHRVRYGRVKRLIDVLLALVVCPLFLVLVPFVVAGNLLSSRGPLLYRQDRVGKGGRIFVIRKFRTMKPDAGPTNWTTDDDPRIARFGHFLRRTHLDELPQVANILKGDLAIVGPRPEQPRYVAELRQKIPFYGLRHLVRPGLTGWAQVKYPYGADELDAGEKLQYEFYYLRHQSLALDLRIMSRTLRTVVSAAGR